MLDDPTVELSRVMQENARQQHLQAYLKGLKFDLWHRPAGRIMTTFNGPLRNVAEFKNNNLSGVAVG